MPKVRFVRPGGDIVETDAAVGENVMEVGRRVDVPEMVGECGGSLSCATCHVYVAQEWWGKLPPAHEFELDLLEGIMDLAPTSRLSCQVALTADLDGLTVEMPIAQA